MKPHRPHRATPFLLLTMAVGARAQSYNIDIDGGAVGAGVPSTSFGAVGSSGVWNSLAGSAVSLPLQRTDGVTGSSVITRSSSAATTSFNNASTTGDVELLMDDYQRLDAVPLTLTINNLAAGHYRVITYANRLNGSSNRSSVTVANSISTSPQVIGGALSLNTFTRGVTHAEHIVALPSTGTITVTLNNVTGSGTGGLNGLQLVQSTPTRIYADASKPPGGDGLSWSTAINDLQQAVALAGSLGSVTEVWVAKGTYRPAAPGGSRSSTFVPIKRLYGGFAGTETLLTQRNIAANPTILSGDLNADDAPGFANRSDNAYHVLTAGTPSTTARIDGFTIRGGYADGTVNDESGGGLYISDPFALTVDNCTFTDNYAANDGAAVYVLPTATSPPRTLIISRTNFTSNWAVDSGAAVRLNGASSGVTLHLINCGIRSNTSVSSGAVHMLNGTLHMVNCLVTGNTSTFAPGVVLRGSMGSTSLRGCTIVHNFRLVPGVSNGLILQTATGTATLANSIVRFNDYAFPTSATSDVVVTSGALNVVSSAVTGVSGSGVITSTPDLLSPFGPDLTPASSDEDYRPLPGSVLVDRGDTAWLPSDIADLDADANTSETIPHDLAGRARQFDAPGEANEPSSLDIGCYENARDSRRWSTAAGTLANWNDTSSWAGGAAPGAAIWAYFQPTTNPFIGSRVRFRSTSAAAAITISGTTEFTEETAGTGVLTIQGLEQPALTVSAVTPGTFMYAAILSGRFEVIGSVRIGDRAAGTSGQLTVARPSGLGLIVTDEIKVERGTFDLGAALVAVGDGIDVAGGAVITSQTGRAVANLTVRGDVVVFANGAGGGTMTVDGAINFLNSPIAGDASPALNLDIMTNLTADAVTCGSMSLADGTLRLNLWPGTPFPPVGSEWTLLSAGSRTGTFRSAFLPGDATRLTRLVYEDSTRSSVLIAQVDTRDNVQNLNPPIGFSIPGNPAAAAVGKIRNDALPLRDLAVVVPNSANPTGSNGILKILLNQGVTATTWNGYAAIVTNFATQRNPSGVCIADFNADGFNDVAVVNRDGSGGGTGSVSIFRNNGAGTLISPATTITVQIGAQPSAIAAGDLDGDGKPDLAVTNAADNTLSLLRNTSPAAGVPAFSELVDEPVDVGVNPVAVFIADIDKDGDGDIGVANSGSDDVTLMLNGGAVLRGDGARVWGGFGPPRFLAVDDEPSSIQPGNIDNGKDDEIVVANAGDGSVSVLISGGSGEYSASSGPIGTAPTSVALLDIDNDPEGRLDIVAVTHDAGTAQIGVLQTELGPNGEILLTSSPDIESPDPPTLILADDVNGDGTADLIAVNPDTVALRNESTGEVIGARGSNENLKVRLNYLPCPADLTGDRVVSTPDLTFFIGRFGRAAPPGSEAARADFNHDGTVNTPDLPYFLGRFGVPCP